MFQWPGDFLINKIYFLNCQDSGLAFLKKEESDDWHIYSFGEEKQWIEVGRIKLENGYYPIFYNNEYCIVKKNLEDTFVAQLFRKTKNGEFIFEDENDDVKGTLVDIIESPSGGSFLALIGIINKDQYGNVNLEKNDSSISVCELFKMRNK
jgi:hypothetical protein